MNDLISIIVFGYSPCCITKCLDSIFNQTYKNIEIILVCNEVLHDSLVSDERIKVVYCDDSSPSKLKEIGIKNSSGNYIGFVSSNDYIHSQMYEIMLRSLLENRADISMCSMAEVNYKEVIIKEHLIASKVHSNVEALECLLDNEAYVPLSNKLIRREILNRVVFSAVLNYEDYSIAHELLYNAHKISAVEEILYFSRIEKERDNIQKLDLIDGLISRTKFFLDNGLACYSDRVFDQLYSTLIPVRRYISSKDSTRVKEIDRKLNGLYKEKRPSLPVKRKICFENPTLFFECGKIIDKIKTAYSVTAYIVNSIGKKVVFIDTPTHGNLGDHAIVVAEKQSLSDKKITYIELTSDLINKNEELFARFTSSKKILIVPGGGFLGSLWPEEEYRFRRILKAFKKNKIVVLPQTVTFDIDSPEGISFFNESKEIYESHPNLEFRVREEQSYNFIKGNMPKINVVKSPDLALSLKYDAVSTKRSGVILCLRNDIEKNITEEEYKKLIEILDKRLPNRRITEIDTIEPISIYPGQRDKYVYEKLHRFETAELVITDRLHGMIFSAITDTPCIAIGNSNGKVKAVYNDSLRSNPLISYVDNINEIDELIQRIN